MLSFVWVRVGEYAEQREEIVRPRSSRKWLRTASARAHHVVRRQHRCAAQAKTRNPHRV